LLNFAEMKIKIISNTQQEVKKISCKKMRFTNSSWNSFSVNSNPSKNFLIIYAPPFDYPRDEINTPF